MVLEDAAMFIDQNTAALQKPAELKFGWGGELSRQPWFLGWFAAR